MGQNSPQGSSVPSTTASVDEPNSPETVKATVTGPDMPEVRVETVQ
jgi:hypothetical protein